MTFANMQALKYQAKLGDKVQAYNEKMLQAKRAISKDNKEKLITEAFQIHAQIQELQFKIDQLETME